MTPNVVGAVKNYLDAGFTTFDAADHYGESKSVMVESGGSGEFS